MKRVIVLLVFACSLFSLSQQPTVAPPAATPKKPVTEDIQGVKIADDYRWLENNDNPAVKAWVAAQDKRARSYFQALPEHAQIVEWLKALAKTRSAEYYGIERSRDSLCADVLEALVGAIQIDQGPEAARTFIARTILPMVGQLSRQTLDTNPKGRLQKIVLQRSGSLPRYRVLEQSGQNNDRVFTVGVFERDFLLAIGQASSIKEAGRLAAREALELMSGE